MPEVIHKDQPSIPTPAQAPAPKTAPLSSITTADLEKYLNKALAERKRAEAEAAKPKEPDWKNITETDAYNPAVFIPVIEHDIPDYMNIKLKDTEYEPVWASKDQRRLGQLLAEGYEFITPEMMASEFKVPLLFNSDKHYEYQDVIAMRVHKRILFGKRRRALEISQQQLKNSHSVPRLKERYEKDDLNLDADVEFGPGLSTYDTR